MDGLIDGNEQRRERLKLTKQIINNKLIDGISMG